MPDAVHTVCLHPYRHLTLYHMTIIHKHSNFATSASSITNLEYLLDIERCVQVDHLKMDRLIAVHISKIVVDTIHYTSAHSFPN